MQQALRYEAEYFDDKKRLLRAIFNETLNHCAEAYRSKNITKGKRHCKSLFIIVLKFVQNIR